MKIKYEKTDSSRIDKFLAEYLSKSRNQIQKMLKNNLINVNSSFVSANYKLKENDQITIKNNDYKKDNKNGIFKKIETIYEDDNYIVLNKPAGLAVHGTNQDKEISLVDYLISKYPKIKNVGEDITRPGIVHRLDKNVSGLILIALNNKWYTFLKDLFAKRNIDKYYYALVYGNLKNDKGKINFPIKRSHQNKAIMAASPLNNEDDDENAKKAITEYEVIARYNHYTLLKVKLITGRTHQIRVHLKAIGHSIVNDHKYNNKKNVITENLNQVFLHAFRISFIDKSKNQINYEIDLPAHLKNFLENTK